MQICPNCGEENPARFRLCGFCGAQLAPEQPQQEIRKTVTVVFSDLQGSTALGERLDSEALREVMSRYFDAMRASLEEHGGTIEKFIGDAVMAVFGLPRVHEDDALRAVRAAAGMKAALEQLNDELGQRYGVRLVNRTGVNTGEVVAGDPTTGQRLVTGDTVNVAARLEQAAPAGEILIGEPTYRLVRELVEVEEVSPLELKGKTERVGAYCLLRVRPAAEATSSLETPLVGREQELALLRATLTAAIASRSSRLATVFGDSGVGKSRLTRELALAAGADARVLRGRCLPYGRGITFWPLVEIVGAAAGIYEDDPPGIARAKLDALVPDALDVADRVASAIGLGGGGYALDDVSWGTRKLFEELARDQPLIVQIDGLHWAEDAFLRLIEHVARTASAPILLLCTARPDLLERRPDWCMDALRVELEPLSEEEAALVIDNVLGDAGLPAPVRARIVAAAEGNPLFVEQLLAMLIDDGLLTRGDRGWRVTGDVSSLSIPGSIQALLAARLDLLTREERALLEPASVVGVVFSRIAVDALLSDALKGRIDPLLGRLSDKRLVRRAPADLEEDAYRFQHSLVRDTTYQSLLKRTRATLHELFADWAERVNRDRDRGIEYDEILGYHLEQAHGYLEELGPLDDHARELGRRAAAHLGAAGSRAFGRGDMGAAANLLRRSVTLLPDADPVRLSLLPDLGEAMMETGEFGWAELYLDEAVTFAEAGGDERLRADALLIRLLVRHHTVEDLGAWRAEVERETSRLIPILEAQGANAELAKAWRMVAFLHGTVCRWGPATQAQKRALDHARRAGQRRQETRLAATYTMSLAAGPTRVDESIALCEEIVGAGLTDRQAQALALLSLAYLYALRGDFERARESCLQGQALLNDLGIAVFAACTSLTSGRIELLADDPAAAEVALRNDYAALGELGERYFRPVVGALLARALVSQDKIDDAARIAAEVRETAAEDDVEAQAIARSVQARVAAARGEEEQALRLALEAIAIVGETDALVGQGDALVDLAHVLDRLGHADAAAARLKEAVELYGRRAATTPAQQAQELLDGLDLPSKPVRAV